MTSIAWSIMFVGILACAVAADIAGYKLGDKELKKFLALLGACGFALILSTLREWMR